MANAGPTDLLDAMRQVLGQAVAVITQSYVDTALGRRKEAIPVGAVSLNALIDYSFRADSPLSTIPGCSESNAVIFQDGDTPILFARPSSGAYRDYVRKFLNLYYDPNVISQGVGYDVDHVASQSSSARLKLAYVALAPADPKTQQSYGSIEEWLCDPPDKFGLVRPNLYQVLKINNVPLLSAPGDVAAGLGIMIGAAAEQGVFPKRDRQSFYTRGMRTARRVQADRVGG